MIPARTGVYKIENRLDGKCYVGSAVEISKRFNEHRRHLRRGDHRNVYLQNAWNCHGEGSFAFVPVLICRRDDLQAYEQAAMTAFSAFHKRGGYNLCARAYSTVGREISERCKQVNRDRTKGKPNPVLRAIMRTPERRRKSIETLEAIRRDPEVQAKRLRNSLRAHARPEVAAKVRAAQQNGKKAIRVVLGGREMCLREAGRLLGRESSLISWRVRTHGITHQQALDHYAGALVGSPQGGAP